MDQSKKRSRIIGGGAGLVLVSAAVYSVAFVEWKTEPDEEPPLIRPLKAMLIASPYTALGRKYPGKVRAHRQVDMAFHVAGPLIELHVRNGQEVAEGALLAKIDPRDFQTALDAAEAKLVEAESLWKRMERLYKDGTAQLVEYEQKKREHSVALAVAVEARKAMEDTNLRAPFAGVIANRFVETFQNVRAKQPTLSLQDVARRSQFHRKPSREKLARK